MSFVSNSRRFTPEDIDRTKYAIRITHLHNGNDPDGTRRFMFCAQGKKPAKYVTLCRIIDRSTGVEVARGVAVCANREVANPTAGHSIALGRAIKDFMMFGPLEEAPEPSGPPPAARHLMLVSNQ